MERFKKIVEFLVGSYLRGIVVFLIAAAVLGTLQIEVHTDKLTLLNMNLSALGVGTLVRIINWN